MTSTEWILARGGPTSILVSKAKSAKKEQKKLAREQSNPSTQIQTPDPVDLLSQSTVIAGWKGDYASVQGVSQTSGAIFMGEMRA